MDIYSCMCRSGEIMREVNKGREIGMADGMMRLVCVYCACFVVLAVFFFLTCFGVLWCAPSPDLARDLVFVAVGPM